MVTLPPPSSGADRALLRCHNIEDLRALCRRRLPSPIFDFIDGGSEDERTLQENTRAFDNWALVPDLPSGSDLVRTETTVLGHSIAAPLILAPTGGAKNFHRDGEMGTARAASQYQLYYTQSSFSSCRLEVMGAATVGPKMFQLYLTEDRTISHAMIERAAQSGFTALCVTVDSPINGSRERDLRNGLAVAGSWLRNIRILRDTYRCPRWFAAYIWSRPDSFCNFDDEHGLSVADRKYHGTNLRQNLSWDDVAEARRRWNGPFAVKGIMSPRGARRAIDIGASAIIVSNHGGRQLDGAQAAVKALPAIVDAVAGRCEVILDCGIRRGTHVVKALALGASACMVGRAHAYGLGAAGQAGVARALQILTEEIARTMVLLGCHDVSALNNNWLEEI